MYGETLDRLYTQTLRRGRLDRIWSALSGRPSHLLSLAEVDRSAVRARHEAGLQMVQIDDICGSSGRCRDFDRRFRPLQDHSERRWLSVARARQENKSLPSVELVRVGEAYYCLDGHHRISVARAFGQPEIEAMVTVWQVADAGASAASAAAPAGQPPLRLAHTLQA
jgi:hypothetical protein